MSAREQKALEIAAKSKIGRKGGNWLVPSQSGNGTQYQVDALVQKCTCPDYETRGQSCKHIFAVEYVIERERSVTQTVTADSTTTTVTETETVKLRYTKCGPLTTPRRLMRKLDSCRFSMSFALA